MIIVTPTTVTPGPRVEAGSAPYQDDSLITVENFDAGSGADASLGADRRGRRSAGGHHVHRTHLVDTERRGPVAARRTRYEPGQLRGTCSTRPTLPEWLRSADGQHWDRHGERELRRQSDPGPSASRRRARSAVPGINTPSRSSAAARPTRSVQPSPAERSRSSYSGPVCRPFNTVQAAIESCVGTF